MKFLITESSLKNFIKNKFDIDLTGKIRMITSYEELPWLYKKIIPSILIHKYLNMYGPMYLIQNMEDEKFLTQPQDNHKWLIVDDNDMSISEQELIERLGLSKIGLTAQNIIDIYLVEE